MIQVLAPILSNTEIMPEVYLLWLETPKVAALSRPGQFVTVRCSEGYDPLLRRPLSVHLVAPEPSTQLPPTRIALLYAVVGRGTRWLSHCGPGDALDLLGPLGNGFSIAPGSQRILLVAGGLGIAPLAYLAQELAASKRSLTLLQGAATASQLYDCDWPYLERLVVTEDGTAGSKGLITDILPHTVQSCDQVIACGPVSMYQAIAQLKDAIQLRKPIQVSLETHLGCGLGACYGCAVPTSGGTKRVCRDGPVFELSEIDWQQLG